MIKITITILSVFLLQGCGSIDTAPNPGPQGSQGKSGLTFRPEITRYDYGLSSCPTDSGSIIEIAGYDYGIRLTYGTAAVICDAVDGKDGEDGADAPLSDYQITEIIDPCGDAPGIHDEVLLRLANNQVLASFSQNVNGDNTRLSILVPGSYGTTDGSGCGFTVNNDGSVS